MAKRRKVTLQQILTAVESGEYIGICLACGFEQEGVEPDARHYTCEDCGKPHVFGAEELLMDGGVTSPDMMERVI